MTKSYVSAEDKLLEDICALMGLYPLSSKLVILFSASSSESRKSAPSTVHHPLSAVLLPGPTSKLFSSTGDPTGPGS